MDRSFVRNAPEIAEELLLKAAGLPKELRSFQRDLLTKESSVQEEKLVLPARMSLADLQKIAHQKGSDLPKIASADVSTEDWQKVAGDLTKIAKRGEEEAAQDVLATAAALVAHRKEATVASITNAVGHVPPSGWTRAKAFFGHTPSKRSVQIDDLHHQVEVGKLQKQLPKDITVQKAEIDAKSVKETGERRNRLAEHAIAAAPAIGLAAGTPLAAAAVLKGDKEKKEEVKIYK